MQRVKTLSEASVVFLILTDRVSVFLPIINTIRVTRAASKVNAPSNLLNGVLFEMPSVSTRVSFLCKNAQQI